MKRGRKKSELALAIESLDLDCMLHYPDEKYTSVYFHVYRYQKASEKQFRIDRTIHDGIDTCTVLRIL